MIIMQDYQQRLRQLSTIAVESVAVPLANEMLAEVKNRIVLDGKKSDNTQIGQYSVKSAYFEKKVFDKQSAFKPTGKKESILYSTVNINTGKVKSPKRRTITSFGEKIYSKGEKGFQYDERMTMFLAGGYKELRLIQGKPIDKINENYTGSTLAAYQQAQGEGFIVQGFTTQKSSLIRHGQELKRGDIFKPTKEELATYNTEFSKGIQDLQVKILKGV